MSRPVIGILGSIAELKSASYGGFMPRGFVNHTCVRSIERNGGVPLILPFVDDDALLDDALPLCAGLLFPGGGDVDPSFYGEEPHTELSNVRKELDRCWIRAAKFGLEHGLPMLGICRGAQLLNVACGGSLYQDIVFDCGPGSIEHSQDAPRDEPTHTVSIKGDSLLASLLGSSSVKTNSMHHQAVKKIGSGLMITAQAEDGTIEAYESSDGVILGVQWHPEDLIDSVPIMNNLFKHLTDKAAKR